MVKDVKKAQVEPKKTEAKAAPKSWDDMFKPKAPEPKKEKKPDP